MYMRKNNTDRLSIPENYGGTSLLQSEEYEEKSTAEYDYLGERSVPPEVRMPSPERTENEQKEPLEEKEAPPTAEASVFEEEPHKEENAPALFGMESSDILLIVLAALLLKEGNGSDEIAILLLLLLLG